MLSGVSPLCLALLMFASASISAWTIISKPDSVAVHSTVLPSSPNALLTSVPDLISAYTVDSKACRAATSSGVSPSRSVLLPSSAAFT